MTMEEIVSYINQADDYQINEIINALTQRYKTVYPDWEVAFLAMPLRDPVRRKQTIDFVLRYGKETKL